MKLYLTLEYATMDGVLAYVSLWDLPRVENEEAGIDKVINLELTEEQVNILTDNGKIKLLNVDNS